LGSDVPLPQPVRLSSTFDDPIPRLTPREREVLELVAEGRSNQAICDQLTVAPKTLERHMQHIYLKLQLGAGDDAVHRRVMAVLAWHWSPSGAGRERPPLSAAG
jgi:ATP/maltotriose-dependent transcriptional regulator MalT